MFELLSGLPLAWLALAALLGGWAVAFLRGRQRAVGLAAGAGASGSERISAAFNSQPNYHGYYVALWTALPFLAAVAIAAFFTGNVAERIVFTELQNEAGLADVVAIRLLDAAVADTSAAAASANPLLAAAARRLASVEGQLTLLVLATGTIAGTGGYFAARRRIAPQFRARAKVEDAVRALLFVCAAIAVLTTLGIVASLVFEALRFFSEIPVFSFLFGTDWNAQTDESFGAIPLFFGTLLIAAIAMLVAAPIGLLSAIYLSEYASAATRTWVKPILEILAGIPTVVYGFFAALVIAPAVRDGAAWINALPFTPDTLLAAQPSNALAAGLVMGVMIIPFVSSLSDDVINAVPQTLRDGAYAMGATASETVRQVVLPAALPGVAAALLLAVSRAIGETMIVVMVGLGRANITLDPTGDVTTVTVQIVQLLVGDSEFDSAKTLSAFALGLTLFAVTLAFNLVALRIVQRFRERYD